MESEMSWRDELSDKYDRLCGLTPEAIGVGGGIDRSSSQHWRSASDAGEQQRNMTADEIVHIAVTGIGQSLDGKGICRCKYCEELRRY